MKGGSAEDRLNEIVRKTHASAGSCTANVPIPTVMDKTWAGLLYNTLFCFLASGPAVLHFKLFGEFVNPSEGQTKFAGDFSEKARKEIEMKIFCKGGDLFNCIRIDRVVIY